MGVEVIDFEGGQLRGFQGGGDGGGGTLAGGIGLGEVMGVAGCGVTSKFSQRLDSPGGGVVGALKDKDSGTFGEDETIAVPIEGLAGSLGIVVLPGQRTQGIETRHAKGSDGGLCTAGQHHVGSAVADELPPGADGIGAPSAR